MNKLRVFVSSVQQELEHERAAVAQLLSVFTEQDGYFVVTFAGPNGNYDRLRVPADAAGFVTPAVEAQLNDRQKKILVEVQKSGFVTSGWCRNSFGVALLTTQRDLAGLMDLGLVERRGKGRGARYVLRSDR